MKLAQKILLFLLIFSAVVFPSFVFAQEKAPVFIQPEEQTLKATVINIISEGEIAAGGYKNPYQIVKIKLLEGKNKNKELTIDYGKTSSIREDQKVHIGETVVVLQSTTPKNTTYQIIDAYRLDMLLYMTLVFFILVIALSRWKGIGAILGLFVSLAVIIKLIIPQILAGEDPLTTSIIGSIIIMTTTIYFAHGFSKKTTIALVSTSISLIFSGILAVLFVYIAKISGLGSDDVYALRFGQTQTINAQGLLLGGILIGSLGALDDITTGIATAVFELTKANPTMTFKHITASAFRIGSEHISSLVNTLVLAYAGVGLPLFLFIVLNPTKQPLWAILNNELIAEEIVRTIAGSIGLVVSVPITIILSAWIVKRSS